MTATQARSAAAKSAGRCRTTAVALSAVAGIAGATAAEAAATTLRISPARVQTGESLRVVGAGWPRVRGVSLTVRRNGSARRRVKSVRADRHGRFVTRVPFKADARPGRYTIRACAARCRLTHKTSFTVTGPERVTPIAPAPPARPVEPAAPQTRMDLAEWQAFVDNSVITTASSSSGFGGSSRRDDLTLCGNGRWMSEALRIDNGFDFTTLRFGSWKIGQLTRDAEAAADQAEIQLIVEGSTAEAFDPSAPTSERLDTEILWSFDDGRFRCCGYVPAMKAPASACA